MKTLQTETLVALHSNTSGERMGTHAQMLIFLACLWKKENVFQQHQSSLLANCGKEAIKDTSCHE